MFCLNPLFKAQQFLQTTNKEIYFKLKQSSKLGAHFTLFSFSQRKMYLFWAQIHKLVFITDVTYIRNEAQGNILNWNA